jgi:hypothetical protein
LHPANITIQLVGSMGIKRSKLTLLSIMTIIFALSAIFVTYVYLNPHITSTVNAVEMVSDPKEIDWGVLSPGSVVTRVINLKSDYIRFANITFVLKNSNPPNAIDEVTLKWDYTPSVGDENLIDENWTPIQFTLTVSTEIQEVTLRSFEIYITG